MSDSLSFVGNGEGMTFLQERIADFITRHDGKGMVLLLGDDFQRMEEEKTGLFKEVVELKDQLTKLTDDYDMVKALTGRSSWETATAVIEKASSEKTKLINSVDDLRKLNNLLMDRLVRAQKAIVQMKEESDSNNKDQL